MALIPMFSGRSDIVAEELEKVESVVERGYQNNIRKKQQSNKLNKERTAALKCRKEGRETDVEIDSRTCAPNYTPTLIT